MAVEQILEIIKYFCSSTFCFLFCLSSFSAIALYSGSHVPKFLTILCYLCNYFSFFRGSHLCFVYCIGLLCLV